MFDHHSVCETGLQLAILFGHVTLVGCHMLWNSQKCLEVMITSINVMYLDQELHRSRLKLCQAPRLDKEKEWTSKRLDLDYLTLES